MYTGWKVVQQVLASALWKFGMAANCTDVISQAKSKAGPKKWFSLSSQLSLRPHLEYHVQVWGCKHKNIDLLEQVQRRVKKKIRDLKNFSYKDKLRELGCSALRKVDSGDIL